MASARPPISPPNNKKSPTRSRVGLLVSAFFSGDQPAEIPTHARKSSSPSVISPAGSRVHGVSTEAFFDRMAEILSVAKRLVNRFSPRLRGGCATRWEPSQLIDAEPSQLVGGRVQEWGTNSNEWPRSWPDGRPRNLMPDYPRLPNSSRVWATSRAICSRSASIVRKCSCGRSHSISSRRIGSPYRSPS